MGTAAARAETYTVLERAFGDIASMNWGEDQSNIAEIARVFSPLPRQLERAARGDASYAEILNDLRKRAANTKSFDWVTRVVENQQQRNPGDVVVHLHRLLYDALLEIRMAGYESNNHEAYRLADVVHNVPLQLLMVLHGRRSYEEVVEDVRQRATRRRLEAWVDSVLDD